MRKPSKYSTTNKYFYRGTNVLINKLDIKDARLLSDAEAELSAQRLIELDVAPITGQFDFEHLKKIHRHIFQDLYDFAGQIRDLDMSKGDTPFAKWQYIEENTTKLLTELKEEDFLRGQTKNVFAKRASYYMAELNVLHPFREGNGRAIREFIRCLALQCGFTLNWDAVSEEEILDASIQSVLYISALTDVILKAISEDADS
jgi:cell filamentation protein